MIPEDLTKAFDPNQPRDEQGRWRDTAASVALVGGGGAAGAAAGAIAARRAFADRFTQARQGAYQQARDAVAPVRAARAKNAARAARHAAAEARVARDLGSGAKFNPAAVRSLRSVENRVGRDLRVHMTRHSEPFWLDGGSEPEWFSSDAPGEKALRDNKASLRARIDDILANGRAPRRVRVREHYAIPQVDQFEREVRAPRRIVWRGEEAVAARIADDAAHFAELGIRNLDDARAYFADLPQRALRGVAEQINLPVPRIVRDRRIEVVRDRRPVFVPEHVRRVDGYPTARDRRTIKAWLLTGKAAQAGRRGGGGLDARIARNLRMAQPGAQPAPRGIDPATQLPRGLESYSVAGRTQAWGEQEAPRATSRVASARVAARQNGGMAAIRRLGAMRGWAKPAKIAAGVTGAVLGAGAGAGIGALADWSRQRLAERIWSPTPNQPLRKADDTPPDPAEEVYRAGARAERPLGRALAEMFGGWTQLSTERLMGRDAALRTTLLTSLDRALAPLDTAADDGAGAEVPLITQGEDGEPKIISVSFDTGSSRVVDYSRQYRVKLAGQIADEAMQTIEAVLRDATLNGQATDVTARLLRQTIGLTPNQASHVVSYRRGLAALDPRVMDRALRDRRFDRTVARALETNEPLSDEQINRMVDAYQRRYLAHRAETIARTEGLRAANNGHIEGAKAFLAENPGFTAIKTWVATYDSRTRPDHAALNGQKVIGLYTPFRTVQGDTILWPHDAQAPLRQQVRCRCTVAITLVPVTVAAQAGFTSVPPYIPWETTP